ncbi:uncharacterized protein BCR38DRAFT_475779 [Pseudomassariella vexata]|uniref:Uncharacterized protein n=1 Tax=Pseudomassariella vexata TaxID=1141098 RepID=A0A1Y2DT41_9PEZI|nr:uncharacterized protein BCR38DRAFT_475779 [Pseudomassariella vexata]ORY62417.1 hypothetical protein BCR38DRAFT_475779 [Pseudomassariella vexata]
MEVFRAVASFIDIGQALAAIPKLIDAVKVVTNIREELNGLAFESAMNFYAQTLRSHGHLLEMHTITIARRYTPEITPETDPETTQARYPLLTKRRICGRQWMKTTTMMKTMALGGKRFHLTTMGTIQVMKVIEGDRVAHPSLL